MRIRPNVQIPGFRGRITAAPGVTQAIGKPLRAGPTGVLRGPLQPGTDLVTRLRQGNHRWVALFKLPRLAKDAKATLNVTSGGSHPVVIVRAGNGDRPLTPRYFGPQR